MSGFNLKYRYEQDDNPLGVIGSFHLHRKRSYLGGAAITTKRQYASLPARLTV
ncbi:hypothetical protein KCP74_22265 [Salmonella enterica subsp. enterica]|nr:hypothetical protein KCP74_22265 [Salmonella enterica subsp. enterica]